MVYVKWLNLKCRETYEQQKKVYEAYLLSAKPVDAVPAAEPIETMAPSGTDDTSMNIPNSQIISFPDTQNISNPSPQNNSSPPIPESPSQISPNLPLQALLPPTAARTDPEQGEQRTDQNLNANNLTMNQALEELFELLQSRRAAEVAKPPTIEAQQIEVAPGRAEPLSFMTLQTVEGIVEGTDFSTAQGQPSWENEMEKIVNLGHVYSSVNTVTGEMCYMVDAGLYKNILLAVAARKQNEQSLATAAEKIKQHIEQIGNSNERIMQGEKSALERMSRRMNKSFTELREEHHTRMKNVMSDIRVLNDSMIASAEHSTSEMQRLRFQVERYDQIFPIFQAQVKDMEQLNKRLRADLLEEKYRNEQMKIRLDKAEALAISLGASNPSKRRRTSVNLEHDDDVSDQSSSSDDEEGGEEDENEQDEDEQDQSSSSSPSEYEGGETEA